MLLNQNRGITGYGIAYSPFGNVGSVPTNNAAGGAGTTGTPSVSSTGLQDLAGVQGSVRNILSSEALATELESHAHAANYSAAGYDAEAEQYGIAQRSAEQNANQAFVSGQVQSLMEERQITKTVGGIAAQAASNGFKSSGSAHDIMADSLRQGTIQKQLDVMQGNTKAAGYLEESAAASSEGNAASIASAAARQLAADNVAAASTARAQSVNDTNLMRSYLGANAATYSQGVLDYFTNATRTEGISGGQPDEMYNVSQGNPTPTPLPQLTAGVRMGAQGGASQGFAFRVQ
jgi:hypothetical protein